MAAVALLGLREGDAAGGDAQRRGEHGAHVGGVELGVWDGIQWKIFGHCLDFKYLEIKIISNPFPKSKLGFKHD